MRILFLNDLGFQYGAGVAQARQIQSLLLGGHTVAAVCGAAGDVRDEILFTRPGLRENWAGLRVVDRLFARGAFSPEETVDGLLLAVAEFYPDLVVVGNLHFCQWPVEVIGELRRLGCRVVAFLHDMNLLTGRCVYPGDCRRYLTGCDAACPTPDEYPASPPDRIADAWRLRRRLFTGEQPVPLAANSDFVRRTALAALPGASVQTVYYGADEEVFCPGDQAEARAVLGLPMNRPVVLAGAVNLREPRKGGRFLREVVGRLAGRIEFAAFGHPATDLPAVRWLGYHNEPARLAQVYRAADLFIGTAIEEAFGQVILEAALCGRPCVAFAAGGVPEIITSGETGALVPVGETEALVRTVEELANDRARCRAMGERARADSCVRFSLERQLYNWEMLLGATPADGEAVVHA